MKQFSEHFNKKANTVKLREAEKRDIRERLAVYMEYHPLPAEMKEKKAAKAAPLATDSFTVVSIPFAKFFKFSASFAVLVLLVVPVMAEKAIPGDALYPVKVNLNEELRSSLTFDGYEKVEWETERLSRRIAEARTLANQGMLTEEVEAEVAEAVRKHTASAQREIAALRAEDKDAAMIASITFDTTLEMQSSSLKEDRASSVSSTTTTALNLPNLIAEALDESRDKGDDTASSSIPSYDSLMAKVEQNTTRIYELREFVGELAQDEALSEVDRRIEDVERDVQEVIDEGSTAELEARESLVDVLQRTQKIIVYMTEIDVKESFDIDTMIPVVLTEAEKDQIMAELSGKLEKKIAQIETTLEQVEDENVVEKVTLAMEEIDTLESKMASSSASSTDPADFVDFTTAAQEAIVLADDSLGMMASYLDPIDENATTSTSTASSSNENNEDTDNASTTEEVDEDDAVDEETTSTSTASSSSEVPELDIDIDNSATDTATTVDAEVGSTS